MGQTECKQKYDRLKLNNVDNHININDLTTPIKRQRLPEHFKKQTRSNYMLFTRNSLYI